MKTRKVIGCGIVKKYGGYIPHIGGCEEEIAALPVGTFVEIAALVDSERKLVQSEGVKMNKETKAQLRAITRESRWSYTTIEDCYKSWPSIQEVNEIVRFASAINVGPLILVEWIRNTFAAITPKSRGGNEMKIRKTVATGTVTQNERNHITIDFDGGKTPEYCTLFLPPEFCDLKPGTRIEITALVEPEVEYDSYILLCWGIKTGQWSYYDSSLDLIQEAFNENVKNKQQVVALYGFKKMDDFTLLKHFDPEENHAD